MIHNPLNALQRVAAKLEHWNLTPPQAIVLSFLAAILVGTFLLALPVAHAPDEDLSLLDALFTATSAVCVTGLIVVDTGSDFSRFGQVVIMLLIKSGGLGILTLGILLAFATRRRLGFQERLRLQEQVNAQQPGGVVRLLRNLVLFTVAAEALGTLLLYIRFGPLLGPGEGLFFALFHSISAFNNAGFALYADSLMGFVGDPLVSLTIASLFILGGIGSVVVFDIALHLRKKILRTYSLHTKLVLFTTGLLIVVGTCLVWALEWTNPNTLAPLSFPTKLLAGFFQAVTPRTAGFNTLDFADMRSGTLIFVMLLMFIGASPSSTGGGVKTVTFLVLVGSAWRLSRGHGELTLFGRRIDYETVIKAAVIVTMGAMLVGAALTALAITEGDLPLVAIAFETVSAFATVGLSLGITAQLSTIGQVIIIILMFLGRVGLLTFALSVVEREPEANIKYPAEDVIIG